MAVVFIGDELSAAGFRLAGVEVMVPHAGEEPACLEAARHRAQLVLITAEYAGRIPRPTLAAALAATAPLLLVIPDVRYRVPAPDLVRQVRAQLGIET